MTFPNDLSLGTEGENLVARIFKKHGIELVKNTDTAKLADYDLIGKFGQTKVTLEVKYDRMSDRTKNIAIEYHNSNKDEPSGISATKAKLWTHIILDSGNPITWLTSVMKLRNHIKNKPPFKTIISGGDNNANMYLYHIDDICRDSVFTRIDMLETADFNKVLRELLKKDKDN